MKARYLDDDEIRIISEHMSARAWLPFQVAIQSGLRIGDVLKIRRRDIRSGGIRYRAEKTGKLGFAKLPEATLKALRAASGRDPDAFCFPGRKPGKHLTRQAAWSRIKRAAKQCGISLEGCSPHALRKTFGVHVYQTEGMDAARAKLQHTDVRTTEVYVLADWTTGSNAQKPLTRGDLEMLAEKLVQIVLDRIDK